MDWMGREREGRGGDEGRASRPRVKGCPSLTDAEMKSIITDGKGKMKAVKTVSGADVDNVVAYVRSFKK